MSEIEETNPVLKHEKHNPAWALASRLYVTTGDLVIAHIARPRLSSNDDLGRGLHPVDIDFVAAGDREAT